MLTTELNVPTVRCADDWKSVVAALDGPEPVSVLLVDSGLPGLGRLENLRSVRIRKPGLRIVVLAWHPDRSDAFEALGAGAHGYIPKDLADDDLAEALKTVFDGHIYVPAIISEVSSRAAVRTGQDPPPNGDLTHRQREVLGHLADGLSNKEIARALKIAEGTVKVHITAAFRVLHVHNRVSAATALQRLRDGDRYGQPDLPGVVLPGLAAPRLNGNRRNGARFLAAGAGLFGGHAWMADLLWVPALI